MPYPSEIDNFEQWVDRNFETGEPGTIVKAEHYNSATDSIKRIQQTLGLNPQGEYQDVAARLNALGGGGGGGGNLLLRAAWGEQVDFYDPGAEISVPLRFVNGITGTGKKLLFFALAYRPQGGSGLVACSVKWEIRRGTNTIVGPFYHDYLCDMSQGTSVFRYNGGLWWWGTAADGQDFSNCVMYCKNQTSTYWLLSPCVQVLEIV